MRKIGFFILFLSIALCSSCASRMTEVKPLLKPRVVSIAQRIADQKRWLDQDIAAKSITLARAKPIDARLREIKGKYERLKSAGPLTQSDSQELNRMLDDTSDRIFRLSNTKEPGTRLH